MAGILWVVLVAAYIWSVGNLARMSRSPDHWSDSPCTDDEFTVTTNRQTVTTIRQQGVVITPITTPKRSAL